MKFRAYNFVCILYTDNDRHLNAIKYIQENYSDYVFIFHDKDVNEVGEDKKPHFHVLLQFKNSRWNTALAKELDIEENLLQECKNVTGSLKYFIHFGLDNKYQYSIEDCVGSSKLLKRLEKVVSNGKDENEKTSDLIDYINEFDGIISVLAFSRYCCTVGMWDVFRRASSIFLALIQEHNREFETENRS